MNPANPKTLKLPIGTKITPISNGTNPMMMAVHPSRATSLNTKTNSEKTGLPVLKFPATYSPLLFPDLKKTPSMNLEFALLTKPALVNPAMLPNPSLPNADLLNHTLSATTYNPSSLKKDRS